MFRNLRLELIKHSTFFVFISLLILSLSSFFYFFSNGQQHMLYGDALSRMNISRKIVDNLTPGLAQLGNVWLPLPQLLMLPFTSIKPLWQSGIAGAIVSMSSFILGGILLFKAGKILSSSTLSAFLATLVYALNVNILYLQTTAMSEPIFLCLLIACIYCLIQWVHTELKTKYLILAGLSMMGLTLVRYEALALLLASLPVVFILIWKKSGNYHKAEGAVIMYGLLACLGFAMWTVYLAAIFGDPLYWKNYYVSAQPVVTANSEIRKFAVDINVFQAFWKYLTAVVWMNGLLPVIFSIIGLLVLTYQTIKKKSLYFLPVTFSFIIFAFMVLTLQRNTPIDQPTLTVANLLSTKTSNFAEFNIRYGILMLPMIALLCLYVFRVRFAIAKLLLFAILVIQFYSYFRPNYSVIYQFPISISTNTTQGTPKQKAMVKWMKQNYDGGFIMISALKNDPQMLQMGYDYRTYIHEGTGKYWKESRKEPQKYASWLVFDSFNKDDQVSKYLYRSKAVDQHFNLVYEKDGMKIYKIKTKPDVVIK